MIHKTSIPSLVFVTVLAFAGVSDADVIDFETVPGVGTPTEGLTIDMQYEASEGVTFSLEGGGAPVIAKGGSPITGFAGPPSRTGSDNPTSADAATVGQFFLTDDGVLSGLFSPALIVDYASPTAAASGVILDIDFDEFFTIELRDDQGQILGTVVINAGDPNTGDGVATEWSFERPTNDVHSIRFKGQRQASGAFGLGFDNFDVRTFLSVTIDIKPGSDPNCFNINGHGVIPVAILGNDVFNVNDIDTCLLLALR